MFIKTCFYNSIMQLANNRCQDKKIKVLINAVYNAVYIEFQESHAELWSIQDYKNAFFKKINY